jgi:cell wall-associated NlpC family hydrolase
MTLDAAARAYLGTPWRHLGRSATGIDCIGLVILAARDCGITIPDPAPYAREPQGNRLAAAASEHGVRVGQAQPGDVLLFRAGLYAGHVGIAGLHPEHGIPSVIHAYAKHGRAVCEQPLAALLSGDAALIGAYRLRG